MPLSIYANDDSIQISGTAHGCGEFIWRSDKPCYAVLSTGDVLAFQKNKKTGWNCWHRHRPEENGAKVTTKHKDEAAGALVEGDVAWVELWSEYPVTSELKANKFNIEFQTYSAATNAFEVEEKAMLWDALMAHRRAKHHAG